MTQNWWFFWNKIKDFTVFGLGSEWPVCIPEQKVKKLIVEKKYMNHRILALLTLQIVTAGKSTEKRWNEIQNHRKLNEKKVQIYGENDGFDDTRAK